MSGLHKTLITLVKACVATIMGMQTMTLVRLTTQINLGNIGGKLAFSTSTVCRQKKRGEGKGGLALNFNIETNEAVKRLYMKANAFTFSTMDHS